MYGTQAWALSKDTLIKFENDVKMYGTQATPACAIVPRLFENDVKMYGTQALVFVPTAVARLRMM